MGGKAGCIRDPKNAEVFLWTDEESLCMSINWPSTESRAPRSAPIKKVELLRPLTTHLPAGF